MGIRYYAYAFDADRTQQAVDHPFSILSDDPLADAWGLEPHAVVSTATFEQVVPRRDMLYLDKAWRALQALTGPATGDSTAHASYRMFEGEVMMHGGGWDPWVRTILPEEVPAIRDDLCDIGDPQVQAWATSWACARDAGEEQRYVRHFLSRAQEFLVTLAADGRGFVYEIG